MITTSRAEPRLGERRRLLRDGFKLGDGIIFGLYIPNVAANALAAATAIGGLFWRRRQKRFADVPAGWTPRRRTAVLIPARNEDTGGLGQRIRRHACGRPGPAGHRRQGRPVPAVGLRRSHRDRAGRAPGARAGRQGQPAPVLSPPPRDEAQAGQPRQLAAPVGRPLRLHAGARRRQRDVGPLHRPADPPDGDPAAAGPDPGRHPPVGRREPLRASPAVRRPGLYGGPFARGLAGWMGWTATSGATTP